MTNQASDAASIVQPVNTAQPTVLPPAPDGFVWRFKPTGEPAMIREQDVTSWEAENGIVAEPYDVDGAIARLHAAVNALLPTVSATAEDLILMGYIRADQQAALQAMSGEVSDAITFVLKSVAMLHFTENQVADAAQTQAEYGSLDHMPAHYAKKFGPLLAKISPERVKWHADRAAADDAARAAAAAVIERSAV